MKKERNIIIAITGATGIIYSIRLLSALKEIPHIKTHLIISDSAKVTLKYETDLSTKDLKGLADYHYDIRDIGAPISSGSFKLDTMVVLPCSVKTLSAIANCYCSDLIARAADVTLKEQRKLLLCFRETPLHSGHLKLMLNASNIGAQIMPIMPAFYIKPKSIDDLIDQYIVRLCDQINIELPNDLGFQRWQGIK